MTNSEYKISYTVNFDHLKDYIGLFDLDPISQGRSMQDVEKMIAHTDLMVSCFAGAEAQLIGCARVLTDYTYKAWIFDVRVHPDYQGKGVGKKLIEAILAHEELTKVKNFDLVCRREVRPYYEKFGFQSIQPERDYMRFSR